MICIYHSKDLDGFTSGAIVRKKFPDCKLVGWDYGNPIPWNSFKEEEETILIDISFPMQDMLQLSDLTGGKLTWIDHHISAKKEFDSYDHPRKNDINYIYTLGIAACEIGWKYFFPEEEMPEAVKLLGEYDTWRNQDKERWEEQILPFQFYMRGVCTSPETFPTEFFDEDEDMIGDELLEGFAIGHAILNYQREQDMLACKRASFETDFQGYRAICLNQGAFSSNTLHSVFDPVYHEIMIGFQYNGKLWNVSLRSIGDLVDCSKIAKGRGGGGHKNAAGFEAKTFEEIFI